MESFFRALNKSMNEPSYEVSSSLCERCEIRIGRKRRALLWSESAILPLKSFSFFQLVDQWEEENGLVQMIPITGTKPSHMWPIFSFPIILQNIGAGCTADEKRRHLSIAECMVSRLVFSWPAIGSSLIYKDLRVFVRSKKRRSEIIINLPFDVS